MEDSDGSSSICGILRKGCFGDGNSEGLVKNDYKSWLTWIISLLNKILVLLVEYPHIVVIVVLGYLYIHTFQHELIDIIMKDFHTNNIDMLAFIIRRLVDSRKYDDFTNHSARVLYYLLLPIGCMFLADSLHPSDLISWNYLFTAVLTGISIAFSNYAQVYWQKVTKQVEVVSKNMYKIGDYVQIGKEYRGIITGMEATGITLLEEVDENDSDHGKFKYKETYISVAYVYDNIVSKYIVDANYSDDDKIQSSSGKKFQRSLSTSRKANKSKESVTSESLSLNTASVKGGPATPRGGEKERITVAEEFAQLANCEKMFKIYDIVVKDLSELRERVEDFIKTYKVYIIAVLCIIPVMIVRGMLSREPSAST